MRYENVTVLFSGISGFNKVFTISILSKIIGLLTFEDLLQFCTEQSHSGGALAIVSLLNTVYTTLDQLTDPKNNPKVYKVNWSIYI